MNREILFRGERVDNGEWVYGDLLSSTPISKPRVIWLEQISEDDFQEENHEVNPATIGQFTGLTDKDGVKIFEGDVVRYEAIVKTDAEGNNAFFNGSIEYWSGSVGCGWRYKSGRSTMMIKTSHPWRMKVIGNIHDNPELTKQS